MTWTFFSEGMALLGRFAALVEQVGTVQDRDARELNKWQQKIHMWVVSIVSIE
jgi:hypothetical protein